MRTLFFLACASIALGGVCQGQTVTLYVNQNYEGPQFTTSVNVARLPAPLHEQASSLKIVNADHKWTILWESDDFDTGDDQWWIEGSREIPFMNMRRPHGEGWNDLVKAVSFSDTPPPWDESDNRSICLFKGLCAPEANRRVPSNPVIVSPNREHPGWFLRVCAEKNDPGLEAINIQLGRHSPGPDDTFLWRRHGPDQPTWKKGDPTTIDLPMNFLYVRDLWLRGEGVPTGKHVSMCTGYYDHITWRYAFEDGEDHQPDQDDRRVCDC